MYELTLTGDNGKTLTFNQLGGQFTIAAITGLNPPRATINRNDVALGAGSRYNSSKILEREIQIAFAVEHDAEDGRLLVYDVLRTGKPVRVHYKSDRLDVFVDGYVWNISPDYFAMKQIVTVDIICPSPYFKGAQEIVNDLSAIVSTFFFPFASVAEGELVFGYIDALQTITIENEGNVECGLTIELYARGAVTNPKIYNYLTGDYIGINYTLEPGDLVTITTEQGNKTVTLLHNGANSNLFNYVMAGSVWLQLPPEGAQFAYEVGSGSIANLLVSFAHNNLFEGV